MNTSEPIDFHRQLRGKIVVKSKQKITKDNLHLAYTPGVGEVSNVIAADKKAVYDLTGKQNTVAIVTDGTAVLGLGNIGPEAALPVMEGKAAIFADFANVNAVPICLDTQDTEEIIKTVINIAPSFGGINLEDISAPRCFEIEKRLSEELDVPVFHDDQHGTAIVVLAGIINAIKVTGKDKTVKVVISGAGAAGLAIANLLAAYGFTNYILCDFKGAVCPGRDSMDEYKKETVSKSLAVCHNGKCANALQGADILIGVSRPNQFTAADVATMNQDPIVFALANPTPEIMPDQAIKGGAKIVATGRSDFPNQINNALVFPGLFRGLLDNKISKVTTEIKIAVAKAIAGIVKKPAADNIIPSIFDDNVVRAIADTVARFRK